jgi:hypothetical protein
VLKDLNTRSQRDVPLAELAETLVAALKTED